MSFLLALTALCAALGAVVLFGEGLLEEGEGCTVGWRARRLTAAVLAAGTAVGALCLLSVLSEGAAA